MVERPKVAFVCDDANTLEAVLRAKSLPVAVHASTIVTDDPEFPLGVRKFVERYGDELEDMETGLHLSWFSGKFPNNKRKLFGRNGSLLTTLTRIEKLKKRSSRLGWAAAYLANARFEPFRSDLANETLRQVEIARDLFGSVPYITPHFGIWKWNFLYEEYHKTAHALGIPHRGATKYNRLKVHDHQLIFHDTLNHRGVTADEVFGALRNIRKRGIPTEICWHFGDRRYGQQQTEAFLDERVQRELAKFDVMMPHKILEGSVFSRHSHG